MLQPATFTFLKKLAKNNNKPWFDAHRDEYEAAKDDVTEFVTQLLEKMYTIEPALRDLKAKDCIYRIYKDVRFSKDKTPYKTHFGAYITKGGKKYPGGGFYLHIEPEKTFAAGGIWMPQGPVLKSIRQEIDYNLKEFEGILHAPAFKKIFKEIRGEQLKTVPQGYDADNPAIGHLKMKSFIVQHGIAEKDITGKNGIKKCTDTFATMKPFVDFFNKALD